MKIEDIPIPCRAPTVREGEKAEGVMSESACPSKRFAKKGDRNRDSSHGYPAHRNGMVLLVEGFAPLFGKVPVTVFDLLSGKRFSGTAVD